MEKHEESRNRSNKHSNVAFQSSSTGIIDHHLERVHFLKSNQLSQYSLLSNPSFPHWLEMSVFFIYQINFIDYILNFLF